MTESPTVQSPLVEVRRLLHTNYNCVDLDALENWYTELFAVKAVMRSDSAATPGVAFGLQMDNAHRAAFLYDHRGARQTSSLELVSWVSPPTIGAPYPNPWDHGIQSCAYTVPNLDEVVRKVADIGGTAQRRGESWLLLRDPEGLPVEVYLAESKEAEQVHLRVVVDDLNEAERWWGRLGWTPGPPPTVAGEQIWPADGERRIVGERALVATDDPTLSILLTAWSGPPPVGPTYGAPFHQGLYRFAMAVDDVHEAYAALRAEKLATQPPYTFQLPGTKITEGLTILFIREPNGILVELVNRPRGFFRRAGD
jgi:catechol 2,3-dioxygenase-like lactoylglutathione lyase family enzyme